MGKTTILTLLTVVLALADFAGAQQLKIEPDQRYLLLATTKTSTMQKELDEAASQGFRVVTGSPTSGAEIVLLLERSAKHPETYQYKLLATTRTSAMQRELNEAAEGGYRLLPQTMIAKTQLLGGVEIAVVLERSPDSRKRFEYKLLATTRTSTLQREVGEAQAAGFVLVGMVSRGEHMVIMEREAEARD